jgi:transcriptional regulator GlxA family with amidase domain
LIVPLSIADVSTLDLLLVPGGSDGTWEMVQNSEVLEWIQMIDANSRYTTSVCTGSWVLGSAGLLENRQATTNWYRAGQMMERFGAKFQPVRYIADGKYWTSAGVSAGIDMSFALIADMRGEEAAQTAMMRLYYHPEPPIDAGTPETTDDLVLDMMHQMYDFLMVPLIR